ncbi:DUF1353 domain-containing protein [Lysobacter sp. CFH 32150]|uniref:DUF1353 domain-containing protein n=1 Tax=Lysobacter sp. CFH 32150 TaxID=2927128 RepID=UPI001FA6E8FF|nr:DUF1353 domain-containing protein [Lysobacter sp. CFH 32150]MCI4568455.1 DUF1353 domain-containing protein [Lysobacter sp. CFH 32150]
MIRTLVAAALLVTGAVWAQQAPEPASEREFADGNAWTLTEPMTWSIGSSGVLITVPENFVHDKASIPRALWSFLPKNGQYTRAAVIHDYLYWTQRCTREQADNLLVIAMKESDVGWFTRRAVFRGVRLGGESAWNANRTDRMNGLPRFNPRRGGYGNMTWPQLRQDLVIRGHRDPPMDAVSDYCAFGDSQEVP